MPGSPNNTTIGKYGMKKHASVFAKDVFCVDSMAHTEATITRIWAMNPNDTTVRLCDDISCTTKHASCATTPIPLRDISDKNKALPLACPLRSLHNPKMERINMK